MRSELLILPFVIALSLSLAITYLTIRIYRGLGLVDRSKQADHPKHIHERPVPRGGGIPIYISILFTTIMLGPMNAQTIAILVGGLMLLAIAVLDDVWDISPYLRLGIGLVASAVVVMSGIKIGFVSNPFAGGVIILPEFLAMVASILWITWTMNFVNMGAKGLDGQLPGVALIAAVVMGLLSYRFVGDQTAWQPTMLAFALAGAYAGLLVFNAYPQKIMPGWGGGALAGYFLAVLSMLSGAKVATALIVLGIPLMDVIYAIVRRVAAGRSPVWGDASHLHHKLLSLGWSKRKIAMLYWIVTACLGYLALNLNSEYKVYTIVLLFVTVGGVLLWINLLLSSNQSA